MNRTTRVILDAAAVATGILCAATATNVKEVPEQEPSGSPPAQVSGLGAMGSKPEPAPARGQDAPISSEKLTSALVPEVFEDYETAAQEAIRLRSLLVVIYATPQQREAAIRNLAAIPESKAYVHLYLSSTEKVDGTPVREFFDADRVPVVIIHDVASRTNKTVKTKTDL